MKQLIILMLCLPFALSGQGIITDWQRSVGGYANESPGIWGSHFICHGPDKSWILGVCSSSGVGGDKSQPPCNDQGNANDFWQIKFDSTGQKVWDYKYGSLDFDEGNCIIATNDGGYLLAGRSFGEDCDKTQSAYGMDYWMVKTDSMGLFQWNKRFGGQGGDAGFGVLQSADGGFYFWGLSQSGIGQQVTDTNHGGFYEAWLVRTDVNGNKLWDVMLGSMFEDVLNGAVTLADNSIILVGSTNADGPDGTVSQPNKGPTFTEDVWIVKVNAMGQILWDRRYGGMGNDGANDICLAPDSGFYVVGTVHRDSKLPDVADTTDKGLNAVWLLKLNSLGDKEWDKKYGGDSLSGALEVLYSVTTNTLVICAISMSSDTLDKTEPHYGHYDFWIVCTDTMGNKLLDKTYGGYSQFVDEYNPSLLDMGNHHYIVAGASATPISGNKTVAIHDSVGNATSNYPDIWVIGFHYDSTATAMQQQQLMPLQLYPNPALAYLQIGLPFDISKATLLITDMLGRTVWQQYLPQAYDVITVPTATLMPGMYHLSLTTATHHTIKKFVKQ
ncbi:MAG: T9SS type A sorting domain-containing protein [Bacteroidia bacterium]|nr:T9SS type A sorting domain-containing protein [Bacteroidia bacterium]